MRPLALSRPFWQSTDKQGHPGLPCIFWVNATEDEHHLRRISLAAEWFILKPYFQKMTSVTRLAFVLIAFLEFSFPSQSKMRTHSTTSACHILPTEQLPLAAAAWSNVIIWSAQFKAFQPVTLLSYSDYFLLMDIRISNPELFNWFQRAAGKSELIHSDNCILL